ncbi:MAG: YceD family protein [Oscillospiraceae bacterium]
MIINLKQLYEIVGEKQIVDYAVPSERLDEVKGYSFAGPVTVKGKIINRAGIVILDYTVMFTLNAVCDRCLAEFEREFSCDFEHILVRSVNTDNDEYIVTESDQLDMDELVIMDMLLQIPSKMLCREDCKGLCPHCGTDLNYNECNCKG